MTLPKVSQTRQPTNTVYNADGTVRSTQGPKPVQLIDYTSHLQPDVDAPIDWRSIAAGISGAAPGNSRPTFRELQAQAVPKLGGNQYKQAGAMLGVGALGQAAQLGLQMVPTSAERENVGQIENLRGLENQGKLGLSQAERSRVSRQLMDPNRMLLREQQRAEEARMAGQVGSRSAAGLTRVQRETRRALQEAGATAGNTLAMADLNRVAEQRNELQERIAAQGRNEARRREAIGQAIGNIAKPVGQYVASRPQEQISPDVMQKLTNQYGADEAVLMANMMRSMDPGERRKFNTYLGGVLEASAKT